MRFLPDAMCGTDRTVQIEDDLFHRLATSDLINPLPCQIHQRPNVFRCAEDVCCNASHLTGRYRRFVCRPTTNEVPQRRIHKQPLRVVGVFVSGQRTIYRLPQQGGQSVPGVVAGTRILQLGILDSGREFESTFQLSIGDQTGITGEVWSLKFELASGVRIDRQGVLFAASPSTFPVP